VSRDGDHYSSIDLIRNRNDRDLHIITDSALTNHHDDERALLGYDINVNSMPRVVVTRRLVAENGRQIETVELMDRQHGVDETTNHHHQAHHHHHQQQQLQQQRHGEYEVLRRTFQFPM